MNNLQIFNNEEFGTIRSVVINGEPWFVGKDVAEIFGYSNPQKAIRDNVDDEDRLMGEPGVHPSIKDSMGRDQYPVWINESGLYSLVFRSNLPEAKRIQRWVTSEVLPTLRKTGSYSLQKPDSYMIEDPAERARRWAEEYEEKKALESQVVVKDQQLALMQPKAEFFDAVTDSKKAIPLGDAAKILDMGIGRNKLFEFLRQKHIFMQNNQPYQQYIDAGYFRVVEQKYEVHGEVRINIKTLVFQKGIDWIRKQLLKG